MDLIWPPKDTVVVEIPIAPAEYYVTNDTPTTHIPIEFLIIKKRDMKNTYTNMPYLKNFVGPI